LNDLEVKTVEKKCVFGTREWAEANANFIDGCIHDCKYCYSKEMAIRFGRKTAKNWKEEEVRSNFHLINYKRLDGRIMFPSTHDISPLHLENSLTFLGKILQSGNKVLIVSKPHLLCIKAICNQFSKYKHEILFRFTIGSSDTETLNFWEPGAPSYEERLQSLIYAYQNDFQTSISCEPMLDNKIDNVITDVLPYVTDAVWLGKANFLLRRMKMNGITDSKSILKAKQLLEWQSDEQIEELYERYADNPFIKWKESIKKVVDLEIPLMVGLDI